MTVRIIQGVPIEFLDGRVALHQGDCLEVLRTLPENSVDSVCTDPPYHLQSIVKRFAKVGRTDKTWSRSGPHQRTASGFMNKQWDGGDIAFRPELWAEVLRVLKPGGYIVAFGGSRTWHRMACAIEDAGFITHPFFAWAFGNGFPKATSVSKQIDRAAGAEREVIGIRVYADGHIQHSDRTKLVPPIGTFKRTQDKRLESLSATDAARQWDGWFYGAQSLKPALEPIYIGQKPFSEMTGYANVLRWGTGALNIGACKIPSGDLSESRTRHGGGIVGNGTSYELGDSHGKLGASRWPANLIHDGSEEVLACFPESSSTPRTASPNHPDVTSFQRGSETSVHSDSGSAARFFYTAKADGDDRLGSKHPTVKPLDLIQHLVRLITPPGGTILDCFAGTGTTGEAAFREGFKAVLIEREAEYCADIARRMGLVLNGKESRKHASVKARGKEDDAGPLFGGI